MPFANLLLKCWFSADCPMSLYLFQWTPICLCTFFSGLPYVFVPFSVDSHMSLYLVQWTPVCLCTFFSGLPYVFVPFSVDFCMPWYLFQWTPVCLCTFFSGLLYVFVPLANPLLKCQLSVDSWLGDDEAMERVASGSSGPKKRVQTTMRSTASASTVDSYDAAFQRQPPATSLQLENNLEPRDDDFFGS